MRGHLERLYRLAHRFTGSAEDAEDLVQSLLLKLLPQAERLAAVEQPGPWLARALYNLYIDQIRRRAVQPLDQREPQRDEAVLDSLADPVAESPEQAVERLLTQERLSAALMQLPPEQRALVSWHDIEGYTLEELAEAQTVPIGTLKSRLHRARARLRQILAEPFALAARVNR
ncbi:MAG: RNA polymerase sigma factor [Nevskia sp.]|nr:RNA polymerase sigma factor [Nevskia sp.]